MLAYFAGIMLNAFANPVMLKVMLVCCNWLGLLCAEAPQIFIPSQHDM